MSAEIPQVNNKVPGTQAATIGSALGTNVVTKMAEADQQLFDGMVASNDSAVDSADFTVDTGADAQALQQQEQAINQQLGTLNSSVESTTSQITSYENRIENQAEYIGKLEVDVNNYQQGIDQATNLLAFASNSVNTLTNAIARVDAQIQDANFLQDIAGFFGFGKVAELKQQKASLQERKSAQEAIVEEQTEAISEYEKDKARTEGYIQKTNDLKEENERKRDQLKEQLGQLRESIESGKASLEQIAQQLQILSEQQGRKMSDEEARAAAGVMMDAANADLSEEEVTNVNGEVADFMLTGEDENLVDALEGIGYDEEEALQRFEVIEAIANFEEIGLDMDPMAIMTMSASQLDAVIDSSVTRTVLKTATPGKIMGDITAFGGKKDAQANSEAADEFQDNYNMLVNYYTANNVNDLEASSFITLQAQMYNGIANGTVYNTSDLEGASTTAIRLTNSLRDRVAASQGTNDTDVKFEASKYEAQSAIERAEEAVGEGENQSLEDCRIEFITLTSGYRNATTDSERLQCVTDLLELAGRAEKIEDKPEEKLNNDDRLYVTL